MSLTSYRAAPPRVGGLFWVEGGGRGDCGPGGDLLFRTLRCSTVGAEGFHGRVRDGIGCLAPRHGHQAGKACPRESEGLSCEEGRSVLVGPRAGLGLAAARGQSCVGVSSTNRAISTG